MLVIIAGLIQASGCEADGVLDTPCIAIPDDPSCNQSVIRLNAVHCANAGEIYDGTRCVCDTTNHWIGTSGNCLCENDYFPHGNSCILRQSIGKCSNLGEVYDGQECVCDTANHWTGTSGSCTCSTGYELNHGSCTQIQCGVGEILSDDSCTCNTADNWIGSVGNCICKDGYTQNGHSCILTSHIGKCTNTGEVYDGAGCVCDTTNHWTGNPGSCSCTSGYKQDENNCIKIQCGTGEILSGGNCVCNTAAHWTGNSGSCNCAPGYELKDGNCTQLQCGKGEILLSTSCACDTANHWTGESGRCTCVVGYEEKEGVCQAMCGKGETISDSGCVCDINTHWTGIAGSCACDKGYTEINGKCLENITNTDNCLNLENPVVGKTCLFGKYMQTSSGNDMTDLEWQILKVESDGSFLMISKRVIDVKPYYPDNDTEVTWAQSTMRSWLNGFGPTENLAKTDYTNDNFIKKAFNETEREHIQLVTNTNPKGPMGISGGVDTEDRVFLLSVNEVKNFFPNDTLREALTTEYAKNLDPKVVYGPEGCSGDECKAFWLTRTPGDNLQRIIRVFYNGFICPHGTSLYYRVYVYTMIINGIPYNYQFIFPSDHGVRPAIWIKK